jgi:hypothetical protein
MTHQFGGGRWVRIIDGLLTFSDRVEMALITAGGVTDPEYYVGAVDDFYMHARAHATPTRNCNGWVFQDIENAKVAYGMLCRILSM